jgi:hypothetical protein
VWSNRRDEDQNSGGCKRKDNPIIISGKMTSVPNGCLVDVPIVNHRPWTSDEDEPLIQACQDASCKWTKISQQFLERTPDEAKKPVEGSQDLRFNKKGPCPGRKRRRVGRMDADTVSQSMNNS